MGLDEHCPLCQTNTSVGSFFWKDQSRLYLQCLQCALIFVPRSFHLDRASEFERYEEHENNPSDKRYRDFLERLKIPLCSKLTWHRQGLDYGSGPGPTLSQMFEEAGYRVSLYDPFYAPNRDVLKQQFDFISCAETIEHFSVPRTEFIRFNAMLKPGGWLGLMSDHAPQDKSEFKSWHYHRDPTHVAFYGTETYHWIAHHFGWSYESPHKNVALFFKPE